MSSSKNRNMLSTASGCPDCFDNLHRGFLNMLKSDSFSDHSRHTSLNCKCHELSTVSIQGLWKRYGRWNGNYSLIIQWLLGDFVTLHYRSTDRSSELQSSHTLKMLTNSRVKYYMYKLFRDSPRFTYLLSGFMTRIRFNQDFPFCFHILAVPSLLPLINLSLLLLYCILSTMSCK